MNSKELVRILGYCHCGWVLRFRAHGLMACCVLHACRAASSLQRRSLTPFGWSGSGWAVETLCYRATSRGRAEWLNCMQEYGICDMLSSVHEHTQIKHMIEQVVQHSPSLYEPRQIGFPRPRTDLRLGWNCGKDLLICCPHWSSTEEVLLVPTNP